MRQWTAAERAELGAAAKGSAETARRLLAEYIGAAQGDAFLAPLTGRYLRDLGLAVVTLAKAIGDLSEALIASDAELIALKQRVQGVDDKVHTALARRR